MKSMIFPWSGRGFLILLYAIGGGIAGLALGHALAPKLHMEEVPLAVSLAQIGLALGVWIFALTAGRSELYASTGPTFASNVPLSMRPLPTEPVLRRQRHTFLLIPGWMWGIAASFFLAWPAAQTLANSYKAQHADAAAFEKMVSMESIQKLYSNLLQNLHDKGLLQDTAPDKAGAPQDPKVTEIGPKDAFTPSILPTAMRDWKDNSGRVMNARLERFTTPNYDTAEFRRSDGQAFQVQLTRFCAEDQAAIAQLALQVVQQQEMARRAK